MKKPALVLFEVVMSLGMIGVLLPCLLFGWQQARRSVHCCSVSARALALLPQLQTHMLADLQHDAAQGALRRSLPHAKGEAAELGELELAWQRGELFVECRFRWLLQGKCLLEWQQLLYQPPTAVLHEN